MFLLRLNKNQFTSSGYRSVKQIRGTGLEIQPFGWKQQIPMNNSADYLLMCGYMGEFPPFLPLRERFHGNTKDKSLSSRNALRKRVSGKIALNIFAMLTPRHARLKVSNPRT